ncbi:MAG: hypothetical protein JWM27_635 [Gemmatimonadetes bacterium]|nr:hypothetical protein [Gemmatimonadota bacterium]
MRPGLIEHPDRDFAPVFGVFGDSLPDGWGLLLMDREFRKQGLNPTRMSPLDRLAYIGARGMGALTYHPATTPSTVDGMELDLDALARQAERILEGSPEAVLPALRVAGGSPGGARPKVLVGVDDGSGRIVSGAAELPAGYRSFLLKFGTAADGPEIGAVEAAYASMAEEAGIEVPPTRLFETEEGRYFGAERFDRRSGQRVHMHTLSGLLHASHRIPSVDYDGFLRATLLLTHDHRQVEEAYRRMAFNVLVHNRDDHVKNVSYLMETDGTWRLSPAYDLVFSDGPGGEHTMSVAGEARRPGTAEMLRVAKDAGIDPRRAQGMIDEVRDAVEQWPRFAEATGVSGELTHRIDQTLAEVRA